jgi:hypothetical protein
MEVFLSAHVAFRTPVLKSTDGWMVAVSLVKVAWVLSVWGRIYDPLKGLSWLAAVGDEVHFFEITELSVTMT